MAFDVRQNEETPCILEKQEDGGEWIPFANLQLCPPRIRNGANGIEWSPDGEEWEPVPNEPVPPVEAAPGQNPLCVAAANAVAVLVTLHYETASNISAPTALSLAALIAGLLISILFVPFSVAVILAILTGGAITVFAALPFGAFTEEIQEELRCILFCAASEDEDGVVTFDFAEVQGKVAENVVALNMWDGIQKYLNIIGEDGLNRAGATSSVTEADCSECECDDYEIVFADDWVDTSGHSGRSIEYLGDHVWRVHLGNNGGEQRAAWRRSDHQQFMMTEITFSPDSWACYASTTYPYNTTGQIGCPTQYTCFAFMEAAPTWFGATWVQFRVVV